MSKTKVSSRLLVSIVILAMVGAAIPNTALPARGGNPKPQINATGEDLQLPVFQTAQDLLTDPFIIVSEGIVEYSVTDGLLYWAFRCQPSDEFPKPGYLRRKPSRGGPTLTLATTTSTSCATFHHMAADVDGIYYIDKETDDGDPRQLEFRPTGSPETAVVLNDNFPIANYPVSNLRVDELYLYWVTSDGRILRLSKEGGQTELIAYTGGNPTDLLAIDNHLYWFDNNGMWEMEKDCSPLPCTSKTHLGSFTGGKMRYVPGEVIRYIFFVDTSIAQQRIRAYVCTLLGCSFHTFYTADSAQSWIVGRPAVGPCQTTGTCLFWHEYYTGATSTGRLRRVPTYGGSVEDIQTNLPHRQQVETDDQGIYFVHVSPSNVHQLARLPFSADAITRDLSFSAWEVTQGIQSLANEVPLVAGKTTYVRVYARLLDGPSANDVEVVLEGSRAGVPLPGSPLRSINPNRRLVVGENYDREQPDDGWLFLLPESWIVPGNTVLRTIVDPRTTYNDSNPSNNSAMSTFNFQKRAAACAIFIPVRTHTPKTSVYDPNFMRTVDLYKRLWPVPDVWVYYQTNDVAELEVCWKWGFIPYPCFGPFELEQERNLNNWVADRDEALLRIGTRAAFSDDPDECDRSGAAVHYIGMVHPLAPSGKVSGYGYIKTWLQPASWVKMAPHDSNPPSFWYWPTAGSVLAHETSHNHGRKHIDCGNPDDIDHNYPYPPCYLDDDIPPDHFGFDINTRTPIHYQSASDYMSYGNRNWVSDYTYRAMFNRISLLELEKKETAEADGLNAVDGLVVMLSGAADLERGTGILYYSWVYDTASMSTGILGKWNNMKASAYVEKTGATLADSNLHVRLYGSGDALLADYSVEPMDMDPNFGEEPGLVFMHTFPAPSEQVLRIELLTGSHVLAELVPGPAEPQIQILQPAGGETFDSEMTLSWLATDADEDDHLLYTVQYSPDLGATWQALTTAFSSHPESDIVTLELAVLGSLPGSAGENALIRVLASDGYNTAISTSLPFTLANQPPRPFILSPDPGLVYQALESIPLRGGASDPEEGSVLSSDLQWQVDGRNFSGSEAQVSGLAPGSHEVVLTAQDSDGHSAAISTTLQIAPLVVPNSDLTPVLNGDCEDDAYRDAHTFQLKPYVNGYQASVHVVRSNEHLWVCMKNLNKSFGGSNAFAGLLVDVNNSKDQDAQPDDYGFFVGENGTPFTRAGSDSGGMNNPGPDGLQAQVSASDSLWTAELRIDADVLGGWNHLAGLGFGHYSVRWQGDDYRWPYSLGRDRPDTWAESVLGSAPSISDLSPESSLKDLSITLIVEGSNFSPTDAVLWDGMAKQTTYISSERLTVEISLSDLEVARVVEVAVASGVVNGYVSIPAIFTIENPLPVLKRLNPSRTGSGLPYKAVTVRGSNFVPGAIAVWNGKPIDVAYINSGELKLIVPGELLQYSSDVGVVVQNPGPGGGISNVLNFSISLFHEIYMPLLNR